MTVRKKITIMIAGAGFGSSLLFSIILLWYLWEQPLYIVDSELDTVSRLVTSMIAREGEIRDTYFLDDRHYWIKVYRYGSDELLYQSELTRIFDLPKPEDPDSPLTVSLILPVEKIHVNLGQDKKGEVNFRVKSADITIGDKKFFVITARPVEDIEENLIDIIIGIGIGLVASSAFLVGLSYFVSGLILKPVRVIKDQVMEITEKHLDRRIPVDERSHDEFSALARTLNHVFDRLEGAFVRQKRLIADTSHELKTPLTLMRLTLDEMMTCQQLENHHCFSVENLMKLAEQVFRMEKLIKDLLDLSSLELATTTKLEPVNLSELIESLVADYLLLADVRNISIEVYVSPELVVAGNKEQLYRAFSNLLDNAVKYNVDGGSIEIVGSESMTHSVAVTIGNSGPGIPKDEIPKIFDQFYRVEQSRSSRYGGAGLGLAMVKRIIELHKGEVSIESEEGKWTEVNVLLPKWSGNDMDR
jgi:signal transduction histidine kinase